LQHAITLQTSHFEQLRTHTLLQCTLSALIGRVKFLHLIRYKIGSFGNILPSQSPRLELNKLNLHNKNKQYKNTNIKAKNTTFLTL